MPGVDDDMKLFTEMWIGAAAAGVGALEFISLAPHAKHNGNAKSGDAIPPHAQWEEDIDC